MSAFSTGAAAPPTLPLGFSFDIDGVLLRGNTPLPHARESLLRLNDAGVPWVLLTNGGGELEWKKAEKLSSILDLQIDPEQVILSHTPLRPVVRSFAEQRILVLGCRDVLSVARSYGALKLIDAPSLAADDPTRYPFIHSEFRPAPYRDEPISAVFVLHDPNSWGSEIQLTLDVLRGGVPLGSGGSTQAVPLFVSNPDLLFAGIHPVPRLAAGAFLVALSAVWRDVTGSELVVSRYGKPSAETFNFAREQLGRWAAACEGGTAAPRRFHRIFHVGDNPRADVRGANAAGDPWRSMLVRSGIFRGAGNDALDPAHLVFDGVGGAVDAALQQRTSRLNEHVS